MSKWTDFLDCLDSANVKELIAADRRSVRRRKRGRDARMPRSWRVVPIPRVTAQE